ncbi:DUF3995 domain-containing protein [Peredibacter starrii]|uniref:DUF3995 domain-containing protein n=1 Tax=Peredibacter starrii TaxID=28202 RepID=UPI00389A4991
MINTFALFIMVILLILAAIHIYWGHGGNWPGVDRQDLIDKVFGKGKKFPSIRACYTVASGLTIAGIIPFISIRDASFPGRSYLPFLNYLVAIIFLIRGLGGYLPYFENKWTEIFVHYNRLFYSPLCIGIAISYIYLAMNLY